MSDYHILESQKDFKRVRIVFHVPVPSTQNAVGITWQAAVAMEQGDKISILINVTTEEAAQLLSGEIIEKVENMKFSSTSLNNAQRLQEVKDRATFWKTELINEKQITLNFMGYEGDV